jgi:hypothetical protein
MNETGGVGRDRLGVRAHDPLGRTVEGRGD